MVAKVRRPGASDSKEEGGLLDGAEIVFTRVLVPYSAAVPAGVKKQAGFFVRKAACGPVATRASWIAAGSSGAYGTAAARSSSSSSELVWCLPVSAPSLLPSFLGAWIDGMGRKISLVLAASSCLKDSEARGSWSRQTLVTRWTFPELF